MTKTTTAERRVKIAPTPTPTPTPKRRSAKRRKSAQRANQSTEAKPQGCPEVVVGVDLGDKQSWVYVLNTRTQKNDARPVHTSLEAFRDYFRNHRGARIVIEAGSHSPWVAALLQEELQLEVLVANPRKLKLISASGRKNDRCDAELLARVGAFDPELLAPIQHRGKQACADMAVLQARDLAVRERTRYVNFIRGSMKKLGLRLPKCDARYVHARAHAHVPAELKPALLPLLDLLAAVEKTISHFDKEIERISQQSYPEETACLRQVPGVGPITALAFVLTIEDPARFSDPRQIGAYLGLVPRQHESGDRAPELRVTKAGNGFLRRLLVQCGQYILGHFGPDTDLKRWGQRLAERGGVPSGKRRGMKHGGKNSKKRAVVAVARKLAVLLLILWKTRGTYVPLRDSAGSAGEAA